MTEAMSIGLPVVGFNNCAAVNELVRDGENGILCEDGVESFAKALSRLMKNKEIRIRFGRQAHEDMKAYSPDVIWQRWEELMKNLLEGK
jgi:glycosyltransferase involved in cell wall biosynthesis